MIPPFPPLPPDAADAGLPTGALAILRGITRHFTDRAWALLTEVTLANGRRVDVMAIDRRGQITVVEIKSSVADFRTDRKWQDYLPYCDQFAFAVGPGFPRQLVPDTVGLFVADAYGAEEIRPPVGQPLPAARRRALTLRFVHVASARLLRLADPAPDLAAGP